MIMRLFTARLLKHLGGDMKIQDFQKKKDSNKKISMVTCYDYTSAKIVHASDVDCVLVGDSVAMTMHGYTTTVPATVEMMVVHTQAVARAITRKFILGDLPFLSYRKDLNSNMDAVQLLMQSGAHAVKLEGAIGNIELIKHVVHSGVPVMGHIGLTPQSVHQLGGFKVQGKEDAAAQELLEQARRLEDAGCFSLVLECVPSALAKRVTDSLHIPTIGIGAGPYTSGQVLVFQDMLGMQNDFQPKFLKTYMNGFDAIKNALNDYHREVEAVAYPDEVTHCY